jgi:uncharacterized protein YhaN
MMKINTFKLLAYGPFSDKIFDFSGKDFGLHVIFGLNEAGKSTALRALIGLFYGFGHILADDWLHDYSKLAVGASLNLLNGEMLNLSRYKRRKNDLINDDTGEPFEQAKLDLYLGKMGRENFEHAFGISHSSLRQGVESVLAAGGDLGHALFAATSGLNTLKQVTVKLEGMHNLLFTPRKKTAAINAGISQLSKLRKEQREASAGHRQWKIMKKQLDDLQQSEVEGIKQIEALGSKISLLSRYHNALKFVAIREQLEKDLSELGVVPDLPDDFSQRRIATQVAIKESVQAESNLARDLDDIEEKLNTLTFDEKIIANEKLIKDLADEAHVHSRAAADSKAQRARIYQHNETAQQTLDLLRPGLTLDSVQALRLSKPEKSKIQRLGAEGAKAQESVDSTLKALLLAEANLEKAHAELDQLEKPKDTSALADCLTRAAEYGKLEDRLSDAKAQLALTKEQVDADLAALGLWTGDISELEKLPLPTEETMRAFETDLADADRQLADTEKEIVRIQEPLKEKEKTLLELTKTRKLPSLDDLISHRNLRDRGWQSVRTVWLEGGDVDHDFITAFPESRNLAEAYEKSVTRADGTADVLREDADAVARAEALRTDIRDQKKSLKEIKAHQAALGKDRAALWSKWEELWNPIGIDPLTPREMAAWSGRVIELKRNASDVRKQQTAADQLQADIERIRADIVTAFEHIAVNYSEKSSYSAIIELARRVVKHNDQLRQNRLDLELRITALKEDINAGRQRKNDVEQNLRRWSSDWAKTISKLGFSADARPEDVNDFVLALDDVFTELEKARERQQRIDAMQHNRKAYAKQVAEAVVKLAHDLKDLEPEAAAIELNARLSGDKERGQEYRLLEKEKRKKRSDLSKENEKLAALEETLRLLCIDAHADNPDQLPDIETRAAAKIKLTDKLDTINERLAELASGQNLQEFVSQVKAHDPDELVAKLEKLEAEKKDFLSKQKHIVQELALATKELQSIGGESLAAAIAEEAEGLVGKIQGDVEYYVKLRLASAILTKAMERYRQSNQSPVLSMAGNYFKTMTKGSFAGLRADFDDKGDPIIKAERPDGKMLTLAEMSDGSRDQLFLALRLGGLSRYVKANGPMPFIVDDVLVHFDDNRSAAALAALGELAKETQVVFFTHHKHLVGLAKSSVSDKILRVHEL